jgi:hypothetical protein
MKTELKKSAARAAADANTILANVDGAMLPERVFCCRMRRIVAAGERVHLTHGNRLVTLLETEWLHSRGLEDPWRRLCKYG